MEREIGTGTTYGSHFQFIRPFFLERHNEEKNQDEMSMPNCNLVIRDTQKRNVCNVDWIKVVQDIPKKQFVRQRLNNCRVLQTV
jgi:hypothetical protein